MSRTQPRRSTPPGPKEGLVPHGRELRDGHGKGSGHDRDTFLKAIQTMVTELPGCNGGFTIEIRPISTFTPGPTVKGRGQMAEASSDSSVKRDLITEPTSQACSWRRPGRAVLSLKEGADALNIGRTTLYRLIKTGQIRVIHVGHRTLIPIEVISSILESGL